MSCSRVCEFKRLIQQQVMLCDRASLCASLTQSKDEQNQSSVTPGHYTRQLCLTRKKPNFSKYLTGFKHVTNSLNKIRDECDILPSHILCISPKTHSHFPGMRRDGVGEQGEAPINVPADSRKKSPFISRDP